MTKLPTLAASSFNSGLFQYVASSELNENLIVFQKFGENPDVDTLIVEDVWDVGGIYEYQTEASVVSMSSTSAEDNPVGLGVGYVSIQGLDEEWNLTTEVVEMNGTTPVESVNQYIRVFRLRAVAASDENNTAAGDIEVKADALTVAAMKTGNTSTKMTMLTVPDGYSGFISSVVVSGGPNDDFIIEAKARVQGGMFFSTNDYEISNSSTLFPTFNPAIGKIEERTDIKFSAVGVTNNSQVRVQYTCVMIKNDFLSALANRI